MNLRDLVGRALPPEPWVEGESIPWADPAFSRRMLREHLSQDHDAASRRLSFIDDHVRWIRERVLTSDRARVLDLGCGPGFYLQRLARRGHRCVGVDVSPASIRFARDEAARESLPIRYIQGDMRMVAFGDGFDLVLLLYGEFNAFRPEHAREILVKARDALAEGGRLLLEMHTLEAIRARGLAGPSWSSEARGLFSDGPHLVLRENFWHQTLKTATSRWYVVPADTGEISRHAASWQAYGDAEVAALLADTGFSEPAGQAALAGGGEGDASGLQVFLATRTPYSRA